MLLGEHAVLHGKHALVCAINRRISVRLISTPVRRVTILSSLGTYQSSLDDLEEHPSFKFVLQSIKQHREQIPFGFELKIDSEFSSKIGFGSSAAVTVAIHAALLRWIDGVEPSQERLFEQTLETVRTVQGRGSGADLAASIFGGCVGFSTAPEFQSLAVTLPITAVYCGYKTPTPEVIEMVRKYSIADPKKYERIYCEIDASVALAMDSLRKSDLQGFGKILNANHHRMDEMGVNTPELHEIVTALQGDPKISGAKISGSGLGDCAVGIGLAKLSELSYPAYHLESSLDGCKYDE